MGRAERQRGNRAERDVVNELRRAGWQARTSRADNGTQGGQDIITDAPVAIEVKDHAKMDLSGWVRQAEEQQDDKIGVVWHKKRGNSSPMNWYVTMSGAAFIRLLGLTR